MTTTSPTRPDPLLTVLGALAGTGQVQLHNARGGFACNSSSSHSIVVLPEHLHLGEDHDGGDNYGWEDFALTTPGEKIRYLAAMVAHRPAAQAAIADLMDAHDITLTPEAQVDHQSQMFFPSDFTGDAMDQQFLREFAAFLTDERVAILGGNDNGGESAHRADGMVQVVLNEWKGWRARKDRTAAGDWWVLFNETDGTKLRLSLDPAVLSATSAPDPWHYEGDPEVRRVGFTPAKAATPELVDVKLTDRCPFEKDCGWCYQGSTVKGTEGDPAAVARLLAALAQLQVFEVAFGGGEPTTWPAFTDTLAYARSLGITPNFTTKNYAWLTTDKAATWLSLVGAVAFSVNTAAAMDRLLAKVDACGLDSKLTAKITVQLIPDLVPTADFTHILAAAADRRWRVTLLGYKSTGRGSTFTPAFRREPGWWLAECAKIRDRHYMRTVAIDTALAESSQAALDAHGVPEWMYHVAEGRFSMYVDAVTATAGPSSYCAGAELGPVDLAGDVDALAADLAAAFASYPGGQD